MRAASVTWSHGTNSRDELREALRDDAIAMIEADVMMDGATVIMAHPPQTKRHEVE